MMDNDTTYISFYNKGGTIRIFKRALRSIGKPKFIRFLLHEENRLLLLEPYEKITFTSFRMPQNFEDDNGKFDVYSKAFTRLISKAMGWDSQRSYRIKGEIDENKQTIIFDLSKAEIITEDNSVNAFTRLYAEQKQKENLDE